MKKLENKVAIITGGSSGMGLETAKLFAKEGAQVYITGRRETALNEAVSLIGSKATGIVCDSANLKDLDRLFDQIKSDGKTIDVLFASAGTFAFAPIGSITEEHFDDQFNLNARGTLFTVQKALPLMNDHSAIIMTGSIAAHQGNAYTSVYSASKIVLDVYARCWTNDLKSRGIRVNVIHPGPIDTAIWANLNDEQKNAYTQKVPMGRPGSPGEIATAALFLATSDAGFISGIGLPVDGGALTL